MLESDDLTLKVKRRNVNAFLPNRATDEAAGYDLTAIQNVNIPPRGRLLLNLGLVLIIPKGHYGRIAPRSGLALKFGIDVGAGVIDSDYRGEVGVLLFNHTDTVFEVHIGDRIAQLILEKISLPPVTEIVEVDETARGQGGFGSTDTLKRLKQ
jgi:dUTP pyrophosphatase